MQQKLLGESSLVPESQVAADESFVSEQFVGSSRQSGELLVHPTRIDNQG